MGSFGGALNQVVHPMLGRLRREERLIARLLIGGLAGLAMYVGHIWAANLAAGEASTKVAAVGAPISKFHPPASLMAVLLAVVVSFAVGSVVDRARAARPAPPGRRFRSTAVMLGTIQMLACGGLCVLERMWLGGGLTPAIIEFEVGISLAIQVVVALGSAVALTLLTKLVRYIVGMLQGGARAPRALPLFGARSAPPPRVVLLAGGTGVRGPPLT